MSGRVCVVTGANGGIGKATATALAQRGAHVVLACRSPTKVGSFEIKLLLKYSNYLDSKLRNDNEIVVLTYYVARLPS